MGIGIRLSNTLNSMNKGIDIKYVPQILKNCYNSGILSSVGIIVNFPTETIEDYNETLSFLESIKNYASLQPGQYTVMRNSIMANESEKFGIVVQDSDKFEFDYCPAWYDMNITPEQRHKRWIYFCNCIQTNNFGINPINMPK